VKEACLICLDEVPGGEPYHARCLQDLFGTRHVPVVDVELAKLYTVAQAMVGHTALSGVQRKISLGLVKGATLQVAVEGGNFILKPQAETFPNLPENEHVSMRLAALAGIEIPPCGLVHLRDGSLAYIVRRFDRPKEGGKLLQEDFCQLAELSPKQKYEGSAELCSWLVRRFASEPGVEALELFRRVLFGWWTGNGDMHLKNFSLLRGRDGIYRLSPAYDMLCTALVIRDDQLALPVGGNRRNVTPREWSAYAEYCGLPPKAAHRIFAALRDALEPALALVSRSKLPPEMQEAYAELLRERGAVIGRAARAEERARKPRPRRP
jgi:serine/threonine-protein kinase HipA